MGGRPIPDRYEPVAIIGLGGQGHVLRAHDSRHDRPVAIKVRRAASDAQRTALLDEARVLLDLDPHPNLPLAREDFFLDDRYCVVMDWIEGQNLLAMLSEAGGRGLGVDVVLEALDHVAAALDHMHAHDPPVLHLDVKPSNMVRRPGGRTVLVDLGLAGGTPRYGSGTTAYLAPEVAGGEVPTAAADVYALAVSAYELLTGQLPIPGAVMEVDGLGPEGVARLREALRRGLCTDPRLRPSTATELVALMRPPAAPSNLPSSLSSFVGREAELVDVTRALLDTRCLTLAGTAGIGKTRLAIEAARGSSWAFDGGTWLVELASIDDPGGVAAHIARAMGLRDEPGRSAEDGVRDRIGRDRVLLVLDNCEHLVDAVAHTVEDLLRSCEQLRVLATSREPLRLAGEAVWRVAPLRVPSSDDDDLTTNEAVRLFTERAHASGSRALEGASDLGVVAGICRTVDGIPLAIELAAALAGERPLDEIASGLDRQLSTLVGGVRTVPRQQTLRAALDWSFALLPPPERKLLGQLCAFAGTFTSEAAEAVCGRSGGLDPLVDRSLCERRGDAYRLLEPVRQFATVVVDAGELPMLRKRHLHWYAALGERARPELRRAEAAHWLERLDEASDDMAAALEWSRTSDEHHDEGLVLAASLGEFWRLSGRWNEGRRILERYIGQVEPSSATLLALASLMRLQGDLTAAEVCYERASTDDDTELAARAGLGGIRSDRGDHLAARTLLEGVLAASIDRGDAYVSLDALSDLGRCAHFLGELDVARSHYSRALTAAGELGDVRTAARLEGSIGTIAKSMGDGETARRSFERAREHGIELSDRDLVATSTAWLASCVSEDGDAATARILFEESLRIFRDLGHRRRVAQTLCELAMPVMQQEDYATAASLLAESRGLSADLGLVLTLAEGLHKLSVLAHAQGDHATAAVHLVEAVSVCAEHDDRLRLAMLLEHGAILLEATGHPREAVVLSSAAVAHRRRVGFPRPARMRALAGALERATYALPEADMVEAEDEGDVMSLDQAVSMLTGHLASVTRGRRPDAPRDGR